MNNLIQRAKAFLRSRRMSYITTFEGPDAEKVLRDLAKFCRAHTSTFSGDSRMSDVLEGRREVWLRIQHHLQLSDEDLWDKYGRE